VSKIIEFSERCPNCDEQNIIQDMETGEIVCQSCGYVQKTDTMDRGQEWRAFTLQDRRDKPRAGAPRNITIHDQGLSSSICYQNRDYTGKRINQEKQIQFYRLRKWNRRAKIESGNQRNLAKAMGMLNQLGSEINVPRSVTETAALVYRQTLSKGGTRGRTIKNLVTASLYIGCRICNVSRSLTVISESANISKKEAAKNYRYLYGIVEQDIPSINTANIISMLVNKNDLSGKVERLALEILKAASELKITSGKSPSGMAAASVYISCILVGEKVTQGSIAAPARVTEVTIRNRYKELVNRLNLEIYL
jgi:transcription initiation factor TFIIB